MILSAEDLERIRQIIREELALHRHSDSIYNELGGAGVGPDEGGTSLLAVLPETGFVRLPTILQLIPVGATTWWEGCRSGRFPKGIKLSHRVTVWRAEDIRALIAEMNR